MTRKLLTPTIVAIISLAFTSCGAVRRYFWSSDPAPTQATSDVTTPGRPLPPASPTPSTRPRSVKASQLSPGASATPRPLAGRTTSAQFPVAKPVPGKPGLVFNPFKPNGGYIDVSGYAPGSKVKDPET